MPSKKEEPEFTVTDRRRFSVEEDEQKARPAAPPEEPTEEPVEQPSAPRSAPVAAPPPETRSAPSAPAASADHRQPPPPPTEQERAEGQRAYKQSTDALDEQLRGEVGPDVVSDEFKITFERVLEPFYITAMMQLGLMGQEGAQRRVDIIGARQTIDTLSYLQEKTKGNLGKAEADLLENVLYQLRMQYLEITNAVARAVQNPPGGAGGPKIPKI